MKVPDQLVQPIEVTGDPRPLVFGEPGDLTLLGARTLEGLSLVVDPRKKRLVAAGPILAA